MDKRKKMFHVESGGNERVIDVTDLCNLAKDLKLSFPKHSTKRKQCEIINRVQECRRANVLDQILRENNVFDYSVFDEDAQMSAPVETGDAIVNAAKPQQTSTNLTRKYKPFKVPIVEIGYKNRTSALRLGENIVVSKAENNMGVWWQQNVPNDLKKLRIVRNAGCGDCMYLALAPMIRAAKPNLFRGVANTTDQVMLQLRRLIASKVPNDTDAYATFVHNLGFHQPTTSSKQHTYDRLYGIDQSSTSEEQRKQLTDRRPKLQSHMMQQTHWGTMDDLQLLQSILGVELVPIVVKQHVKGNNYCPFVCYLIPNLLKNTKTYRNNNVRYVFMLHSEVHYESMQLENGQFIFSWQELECKLPQITAHLNKTCMQPETNLPLAAAHLVEDLFKKYPKLAQLPSVKLKSDGDIVGARPLAERLIGFSNIEELSRKTNMRLQNYDLLSKREKRALIEQLVAPETLDKFVTNELQS